MLLSKFQYYLHIVCLYYIVSLYIPWLTNDISRGGGHCILTTVFIHENRWLQVQTSRIYQIVYGIRFSIRLYDDASTYFRYQVRSRGERYAEFLSNILFQNPIWNSVNIQVNNTKWITKVPKKCILFRFPYIIPL